MDAEFESIMKEIVQAIAEAGYDPYAQLQRYVNLGNVTYITRHGNARERIKELDIQDIRDYLGGKML